MPRRDLVAIPMATGRTGNTGHCSVLFAPRLRTDGTLAGYPEWTDWPTALTTLTARFRVNGIIVPHLVTSAPQSRTYAAVFPTSTPVLRYTFTNRTNTDLRSYGAPELATQLRDLYLALAVNFPDGPPSLDQLLATPEGAALFGGDPLADAQAYAKQVGTDTTAELETPEFHEWLSMIASHPRLLRELGIVVDFDLNLAAIGVPDRVTFSSNYVALMPDRRAVYPVMRTTAAFVNLPDPDPLRQELIDGWLRVGEGPYSLLQVDTVESATRLAPLSDSGPDDEAGTGALPMERNRGLALLRANQVDKVRARLDRHIEIEDKIERSLEGFGTTIELFAEDVTVGYRFDVWDDVSTQWHSLHRRTSTGPYEFPRDPGLVVLPSPDEGVEVLALSLDGDEVSVEGPGFGGIDPETGDFRHPHELKSGGVRVPPTVVSWLGWSHIADRPGRTFDPVTGESVVLPPPKPDLTMPVQLAIDYRPTPATLPRLRFGRTYTMRARAVDLGGSSLAYDPASVHPPEAESNPEFYGRTEALPSPMVVRRFPRPDPGVHNTTLSVVLRSDYDVPDSVVPPDERMVFPPRTGQYLCELHAVPSGGIDPTQYRLLSTRDQGEVEDLSVRDVDTGELLWGSFSGEDYLPGPSRPIVNFLPDPAGRGCAFDGAPGSATLLVTPWQGTWPDLRAGRIQFRAGTAAPVIRPIPDTIFRIFLPKATDTVAVVSGTLQPALLDKFELWEAMSPAEQTALGNLVLSGQHWMFTAGTSIKLVHAVRRPLLRPVLSSMAGARPEPGSRDAIVGGPVALSGISTATVVLRGTWTETVDAPYNAGQTQVVHPVEGMDDVTGEGDLPSVDVRFPLGSTKRALLTLEAEAISKFVSYFTEETTFVWTDPTHVLDADGLVESTVTVTLVGGPRATAGVDFVVDGVAGTVTRQGSLLTATSEVVVQYVPLPVSRFSTEEVSGSTVDVLVPASVMPGPPRVAEVVPAFAEGGTSDSTTIVRTRNGRVARVWLERPWFSSGDFERVAVVVAGAGQPDNRSRWARDPAARWVRARLAR